MSIELIIGLSNPGAQYANTRHNAGAWYVQALAQEFPTSLKEESKLFCSLGTMVIGHRSVRLCIPTTYMNESGRALLAVANYYKILPENILVAHDELDLEPGTIRVKTGGGHGGHNGLRDIINCLGTKDFHRLRVGIGHPGNKKQVTNYVLKSASKDEQISIDAAIERAVNETPALIAGELQQVMTSLHTEQ